MRVLGAVWPELRTELTRLGARWLPTKADIDRTVKVATVLGPPTLKAQTSALDKIVESASQQRAPAVVGKQAAQTARALPRNWCIDHDTQDILVTTTTRLAYGTPEHRRMMVDIALQLGAQGTQVPRG